MCGQGLITPGAKESERALGIEIVLLGRFFIAPKCVQTRWSLLLKRGASMVENSNGNGRVVECTEWGPPRRFKNKPGLNGHTQFKHGHLPDRRDVMPNGKQSQMYQV